MIQAAASAFDDNRAFLWSLLYRMTGCAADADDLVQEAFLRYLEHPPRDEERALRPWLVRVAMNAARDLLRRRRRSPYVGPWLPSPLVRRADSDEVVEAYEVVASGLSTEGRYDLLESVSLAFLLALEALTPLQRAVLLLRDVFDYPVRAAALALGTSEGAVKAAHRRARQAMAAYDGARPASLGESRARSSQALFEFAAALADGDVARVESLLAADARALSDGGGEFLAARRPVVGASQVARLYLGLFSRMGMAGQVARVSVVDVAGSAALLVELPDSAPPRIARRFVVQVDLDADGRIARVYSVLASRKLTHTG